MSSARDVTTVLLVGVGGQGTILAGHLLAAVAASQGLDVKVSEIHGMSQRGGSVSTVVRMGTEVSTMVCDAGSADIAVAFEEIEALRYQHLLKEGGTLLVNDEVSVPVSVSLGIAQMPDDLDARLDALDARRIDASGIANGLGSPRSTNVALMGALSAFLPFSVEAWHEAVAAQVPPKTIEANLAAFDAGRDAVS